MRERKSLREIHRLSWLIASENPETEPRVLPPQEDVLLLEVWNCKINITTINTFAISNLRRLLCACTSTRRIQH